MAYAFDTAPNRAFGDEHDGVRDRPISPDCSRVTAGGTAWRRQLKAVIEHRVIPRLASAGQARNPQSSSCVDAARIATFVTIVVTAGLAATVESIAETRASGLSLEAIFLDLLAPAARRLGDLWLADRLSFFDVTRSCAVLQTLMRRMAPELEGVPPDLRRSILLAPVPGEQHTLGLSMLATFFRRAGWHVTVEPRASVEELSCLVGEQSFDVVALSAAGDRFADEMPHVVDRLRASAGRRPMAVLAGGPAFLANPDRLHGADGTAADALQAVQLADYLTTKRATARV